MWEVSRREERGAKKEKKESHTHFRICYKTNTETPIKIAKTFSSKLPKYIVVMDTTKLFTQIEYSMLKLLVLRKMTPGKDTEGRLANGHFCNISMCTHTPCF